jgi:glucosamine--fructose-6-phosphate aminotransferase (isomerizing)
MLEHLRQLPDALEDLVARLGDLPQRLGADQDIERIFFLGGGPLYGLANEAVLKTKEMSLSYAEAYHPLELRHGPMSMVDDATLVVGLLSDTARDYEEAVLEEMRALGARTLVLTEDKGQKPLPADYLVYFESGLPEAVRGVLYMPVLQLMAYHRAMYKGLNPDTPAHLSTVVIL